MPGLSANTKHDQDRVTDQGWSGQAFARCGGVDGVWCAGEVAWSPVSTGASRPGGTPLRMAVHRLRWDTEGDGRSGG